MYANTMFLDGEGVDLSSLKEVSKFLLPHSRGESAAAEGREANPTS
jgi:hypothetical protein